MPSCLVSSGPSYTIMEGFERKPPTQASPCVGGWVCHGAKPASLCLGAIMSFIGLAEEFKVSGAREVLLYRGLSTDANVSSAGVDIKTVAFPGCSGTGGGKAMAHYPGGHRGSGSGWAGWQPKNHATEKPEGRKAKSLFRRMLMHELDEARFSRAVGMSKQGAWDKWENVASCKIIWAEPWKTEPHHFRFLTQLVYDVLLSPTNFFTWDLTNSSVCQLCHKKGLLEHIFSCFSMALEDGRYYWRHDQVLWARADTICTEIKSSKRQCPTKSKVAFV